MKIDYFGLLRPANKVAGRYCVICLFKGGEGKGRYITSILGSDLNLPPFRPSVKNSNAFLTELTT